MTFLEKYNVDGSDPLNESKGSSMIKEEIEAENEKTHYPLPLSLVEITSFNQIKEQHISKKMMR